MKYLTKILNNIPGVKAGVFTNAGFQEVLVNFDKTGKTVREINKA